MTPVHMPALKIPPIASQLVILITKKNNTLNNDNGKRFMVIVFLI